MLTKYASSMVLYTSAAVRQYKTLSSVQNHSVWKMRALAPLVLEKLEVKTACTMAIISLHSSELCEASKITIIYIAA